MLSGGVLVGAALYPFTSLAEPLVLVFTTISHVFVVIAVFALHRASASSVDAFIAPAQAEASPPTGASLVGPGKGAP